jgi:phosphoesterase RecJ-like protein
MLDFDKLFDIIDSHSKFIITCHVNPDADAIGSELALAGILDQLGKEYLIINSSSTPYNLKFMDDKDIIQKYDEEKHNSLLQDVEVEIFLDLNFLNRTAKMFDHFKNSKGLKVCIDHHTNPENFADENLIDESKSSTGEIIFDFIKSVDKLKLDKNIAANIYSAIMTDTGSFRYSKTTPELHLKTAELLNYGLNTEEIYNKIYSQYKFSRIKLLGAVLNSIALSNSGKVAYMIVNQEILKRTGGIESDVDGFVNFALTSKGVEIGILFFELKDGIKISFRSKGEIPVNELAGQFGGGGHLNASGTRMFDIKLDEILPDVLKAADKLVSKN